MISFIKKHTFIRNTALIILLPLVLFCQPRKITGVGKPEKELLSLEDCSFNQESFDSLITLNDLERKKQVIKNHFDHRNKYQGFNGCVLFAEKGEIVFSKAYGYHNLRKKDSLDLNAAFQLASVSKPITALAVVILKEQGMLDYEDDVRKYIPNFPYQDISIRHLLTHRSGLPNYMYFSDTFWEDKEQPLGNMDMIRLMIKHEPDHYYIPDYRYNYSNTNYALLASIIEKVSGLSFSEFLDEKIFKPLNMENSSVYNKCESLDNPFPTLGYINRWRLADNTYLNGVVGDKGVYSSVLDLYKLDQALYCNKLVSRNSLEEAFKPAHKDLRIWDNYGFGWRLNLQDPDNRIVYHSGWWKGFRSYFIRMLDQNKTIIVLSNTLNGSYMGTRSLMRLLE